MNIFKIILLQAATLFNNCYIIMNRNIISKFKKISFLKININTYISGANNLIKGCRKNICFYYFQEYIKIF